MDPVQLLGRVVELAHSSLNFQGKLGSTLELIAEEFAYNIAILYTLDSRGEALHPEHSSLGKGFVAGSGSFPMGRGIVGESAKKMTPLWRGAGDKTDAVAAKWEKDFQKYKTLVAVPVADDRSLRGVVLLLHSRPRKIKPVQIKILSILGREIAGLLSNAVLQRDLEGRVRELSALSEISQVASSNLKLEPLLDMIVMTTVKAMGAEGGVLRVLDEKTGVFRATSTFGKDPYPEHVVQSGPQSDCQVVRTGRPVLIPNAQGTHCCHVPPDSNLSSCLCLPLQDKDHALGILSVYGKPSDTESVDESFDEDDIRLLQAMTGNISRALARAIHHQEIVSLVAEKEAMVRELSILHATSAAMMKTTHMERLLRVILMAITLGDGLGFNRAMLFLVDEDKGVLEGKTGVGPSSAQDAVRIWTKVTLESRSLSEWLDWAVDQSEWSGEESSVHRVAKRIRVPLGEERCVLIQALQKKKPIRDLFSERLFGLEKMKQLELGEQFACVPVIARGEPLGVILVDNIYSSKPISDKDVSFLTTFASQAGLGIQNAMLYENLKRANEELQTIQQRLIHSERLVTLGEFSASMAHEIRNPLVSIGGYARLLQKKHKDAYSKIIYEEVARLEEILNRILTFSRKAAPMERENVDLNQLIDESLRTLRAEVRLSRAKIEKELSQSLPQVYCDKGQIKQVFLNLVQNALEAMAGQGTLTVRTHVASDENGLWVIAEISDTGEGIPGDVLQNIFNPFFTTKEKGTGLGLPIIQRFVEAHSGKIEVDNHPGEGSTFRVRLPASF